MEVLELENYMVIHHLVWVRSPACLQGLAAWSSH
jgi:hypothetical protein